MLIIWKLLFWVSTKPTDCAISLYYSLWMW